MVPLLRLSKVIPNLDNSVDNIQTESAKNKSSTPSGRNVTSSRNTSTKVLPVDGNIIITSF